MAGKTFDRMRWVKRRLEEVAFHANRKRIPNRPKKVVVFPCGGADLGSSNLRAIEPARELLRCGWRAVVVPAKFDLAQRRRILAIERPQIVLIQKGRHPLNHPSVADGRPYIFDIDDADYLSEGQRQQVEGLVRHASRVVAGSSSVANWCRQYNRRVEVIWTCTRPSATVQPERDRENVVTWAHSDPEGYPMEAEFVRTVMSKVTPRKGLVFRLYGVKDQARLSRQYEGALPYQANLEVRPYMSYEKFLASLREAAIGLHVVAEGSPYSLGKSFGKVLAYLDSGVAVIASPALDHPRFFISGVNGVLPPHNAKLWAQAVDELLDAPDRRRAIVAKAYGDFTNRLTMDVFAYRLGAAMDKVIGHDQGLVHQDGHEFRGV